MLITKMLHQQNLTLDIYPSVRKSNIDILDSKYYLYIYPSVHACSMNIL